MGNQQQGARAHPGVGAPPTLLIVEDVREQAVLIGLAARRKRPGMEIRAAADGFEAASYLAGLSPFDDRVENPFPDIIILDLFMPRVDGFAFLNWRRKRPALMTVPVAVLTSSGRPEHESRARWLGAGMVFRKPEDLLELGAVVAEIIDTYLPQRATQHAVGR